MRLNQDSQNKLLSLFMDVAHCDFTRIVEHKGGKNARFQYGDLSLAELLNAPDTAEVFSAETVMTLGQFQFNISQRNSKHVHIECTLLRDEAFTDDKDARKTLAKIDSENYLAEIDLVHHHALPAFLLDIDFENANITDLSTSKISQDSLTRASSIFFKTLLVTIEGLRLIEHYIKLTRDSLTKLQSRTSLQREIDEQINESSLALCMVHCIDFQHVNRKFGQAKGDKVLYEITHIINQHTRNEDISGRFGGALFGVAIQANSIEDGHKLALKLQNALNSKHYLQNAIRLGFNVGVAFVSKQEAALDNSSTSSLLINRAEQALKAAQNSTAPSIVQWEPDKFRLDEQEFNYLGGIFTPDNVTNYRNMLLLWDITSIIADEHSFSRLLKSVIERLAYTFEFTYAGVVSIDSETACNYAFKLNDNTEIAEIDINECEDRDVLIEAATLAIENSQHTEHEENENNALIIPLGNATKECFFILGTVGCLDLTHDSVMLFVGFARQIGKALKRSQLEDELNRKLEQQNAKLEQELHELKAGMQSSALVYRSAKMQKIVEQTQRAAQTDTTVLVTGESGTGKEKLIHAIHTLSPRSTKPLIIVDCGSIPETLIESELFGHTKGAFTGAQSDSKGKIEAANGGILVLDEIGELPLSMQPKLLRFVQEKHFTPVGSNKSIDVDVKIVAVTNRDLAFEVSQGKFRKDLFYRLNVLTLHNPPLRERTEDIDLLCQHFLSKFYRQFEMDKKFLSERTINLMKAYDWPGNIRELENKLMQASLLTIEEEIKFEDLNLDLGSADFRDPLTKTENLNGNLGSSSVFNHSSQERIVQAYNAENVDTLAPHNFNASTDRISYKEHSNTIPETAVANGRIPFSADEQAQASGALSSLEWQTAFAQRVSQLINSMSDQAKRSISIGSAIETHLLHMGYTQCGSHSQTALLLDLPVSTTRRRLQKPIPDISSINMLSVWQDITHMLWLIVDKQTHLNSPIDTVRSLIARQILAEYGARMSMASQLMGVSEPTMYKLRKELSQSMQ